MRDDDLDFTIARLGECRFPSPMSGVRFRRDEERVLYRSTRGPKDAADMVEYLEELNVGILVAIGGDGTLRGAQTIAEEAARRDVKVSVIGVPKRSTTTSRSCRERLDSRPR